MGNNLTQEFYSSLIQNSHDMITIMDPEGFYKYVSNSVEQHLSYTVTELIGNNALHHIHPDDLPQVLESLHAVKNESQIKVKPFRYLHKNGSWRWLSCIATNMLENPAIGGYVTNSRDITEEVETEALRQRSEAYYKALFFNHADLVFTLNEAGLIQDINESVTRITNYTAADVKDKHFVNFLESAYTEEAIEAFRKIIAGVAHNFETKIVDKQQQILDLSISLVPVWLDNRVTAVHCIAKDITQVKISEKLQKEQTAQLNNILGSITEAFFALNKQWCFTYANKAFASYFNIPSEHLINRNIWQESPDLVHSLFYHKCLQVMSTGVALEFEEYIEPIKATTHYKIYPFVDGIAVCFTDITAKKAAQDTLEKLSLVASKTTNGVIITDKKGKVEWVNNSFTLLTGYSNAEMLQQDPITMLQGPETSEADIRNLKRLLGLGIPFSEELLSYKKSGEKVWVATDITPILNEAGTIEKYIVIYTDISDRKFAEEKLLQMNENLVMQNRDLQQFTYIVSHNLRAPVANMMGLTKILPKLDTGGPSYATALANLDKSALRLDAVICDLSKILSIKGPDNAEATETINLQSISTEVIQSLVETTIAVKGTIEMLVDKDIHLQGKRAYIYSILHNLVTNAIKYRSEERPLHILLKAEQTNDGISLQVQDNGLGMDMQAVDQHIFKLYKRFHVHTEGRGLGLYLVKSQVEAMGGTINVESSPGIGTTFRICFKRQRA
ncbi:PAS domain-containing sensor histidine kinase [Pontibacter sp. H259]|uniref:PAS domain-containing sensor histidine kinase n=1 Tax=Pontibacter sp. H259 TaxID=3133421 RepID=UPI0030C2DD4A